MDTKVLLAGLIGFFMGGLLVSVAATTFDKPRTNAEHYQITQQDETKHEQMKHRSDDSTWY
ncbi:MAG TPA: hypothetical protein VFM68_01185 [Candidatus Saccharimonadales bacterium]|nr:hypothetical protein [Candidatus Saccharimonadales bacterium]